MRRLRPPLARAACWLAFAAAILILLAVTRGVRPDLAQRLQEPVFVIGIAASLATGILAAVAAFVVSLPDRSRGWSLLPLPPLAIWISTIGYGCLIAWVGISANGLPAGEVARCLVTLVLTSGPLSLAMCVMLRHAVPLRALPVALVGGLAVAAITASALSILHPLEATITILLWNFGTAALFLGLAALLGRGMSSRLPQQPAPQGR